MIENLVLPMYKDANVNLDVKQKNYNFNLMISSFTSENNYNLYLNKLNNTFGEDIIQKYVTTNEE